ncbi:dihydropteroate synthase [Natronospira proteinivora]|uniref:Dihydropteroate synthase n=1 Tax=Natronospira proteinivora TaxID=1807133 RepID=A0ABT1G6R0_9GAMM|nr:dihydropteroate synthase [Natronospira proteinivora]MCP1726988.1 dihydropteroate synthase [Natronospira proteinivora]
MRLQCGHRELDLSQARIMGVLNRTPDSFSDGGDYIDRDKALAHAQAMVEAGADIIDIGGESTRPGSRGVSEQEEIDRVIPVLERLRPETDAILSVDTTKPAVMRAALEAGVDLINDVRGFKDPASIEAVKDSDVAVCVMHMQGEPRNMQANPQYREVVREVRGFLMAQAETLEAAGVSRRRILVDPGFGFGKTLNHNLTLLRELGAFSASGYPVLVGMSRKSMIGHVIDRPVDERLYGSLSVATLAAWLGASVVRVHDVAATRDALKMMAAVKASGQGERG